MDRGGAYADILLDRAQVSFPDPRDRALLTELVMGTLRRRGTLDFTLSPHLRRPIEKTDAWARNALRLGAYQLRYTRAPERAVIFETVEAAKRIRGEKIAGLVNAILRKVAAPEHPPPEGAEGLSVTHSAPPSLVFALSRQLGKAETASFLAACLEKPPFVIRANPFRVAREDLLSRLDRAGMAPLPCRYAPEGIVLSAPSGVHADPGFRAGEYLVMDEGAQLIAPLLSPSRGDRILDACAAPGGKTTHLAALAGGNARILAADVSEGRLRFLRGTVSRTGAAGIETRIHDFRNGPVPDTVASFDKILVDAPCTGTGVIRRNPDAKWRFDPGEPGKMSRLQGAILDAAWVSLRAGGLLLYCTCTPFGEENEGVVEDFLSRHAEAALVREVPREWPGPPDAWTAEGFLRLSPHRHGTDGFFAALIAKSR